MPVIEIPGDAFGNRKTETIEFPDDMSPDEINAAIKKNSYGLTPELEAEGHRIDPELGISLPPEDYAKNRLGHSVNSHLNELEGAADETDPGADENSRWLTRQGLKSRAYADALSESDNNLDRNFQRLDQIRKDTDKRAEALGGIEGYWPEKLEPGEVAIHNAKIRAHNEYLKEYQKHLREHRKALWVFGNQEQLKEFYPGIGEFTPADLQSLVETGKPAGRIGAQERWAGGRAWDWMQQTAPLVFGGQVGADG